MMLQRTRDWMQDLLDHHVPPLTREDVVGLGLIEGVGALDSGDEATDRLPYPTIYDTAHVVHIVAGALLVEAGWIRPGESADEQLTAIVRAAEPWLAEVEQALAHPETARSWARAVRLAAVVRHRRASAAARNRALADAFATMQRLIDEDRLTIAHQARDKGYISRADPNLVQTELLLAKPETFHYPDANGWYGLDRRGLLRCLRWLKFPDAEARAWLRGRLREQLRKQRLFGTSVTAATALVRLEDVAEGGHELAAPHSSVDCIVEAADDVARRLKEVGAAPLERRLAYAIALRGARSLRRAAEMLEIADGTARTLSHRLRSRLTM
jgi:hypothetical protein